MSAFGGKADIAVYECNTLGRVLINAADVGFWGRSGNLVLAMAVLPRALIWPLDSS